MLNPARSSQVGGDPPVKIGLIGPSGSGRSGPVWSSIRASGPRMPSDQWYLDHIGGRQHGKRELLSYLNPSAANHLSSGGGPAPNRFSPMIAGFAVFEDFSK